MKTWTKSKPQWTQHQLWETRMRRRLNQCFCSHCLCQVSKKFKKSASLSDFSFRDNYATSPYQQETLWETIVTLRGCDVKPMFVFPVSREIGALGADCDPFPDWGRSPVQWSPWEMHGRRVWNTALLLFQFFQQILSSKNFWNHKQIYAFCIVSAL